MSYDAARYSESSAQSERSQLPSQMAEWLNKKGKGTYDAVQSKVRSTPPRANEDIRIVQYDSCRGLEGWITVLGGLDTFYENKRRDYLQMYKDGIVELTLNPDDAATLFATRWSLISLTRAINTIVITLDNLASKVGKAVLAAADNSSDSSEFRGFDDL